MAKSAREIMKIMVQKDKNPPKIPVIVGITVTALFTCILVYVTCTYFHIGSSHFMHSSADQTLKLEICPDHDQQSITIRSKRADVPSLIKRVARPLSSAPPMLTLANGTYDPPLYHDAGAKCAWGHLSGKRVPRIEEVGISYDSQQLGARVCDDPETCKGICLRMHKPDDPYLCNYFTWNRDKKVALFYFLEPTIKWNLTLDERVETYFWQCKETTCTWFWRPHRIAPSLAALTATQMRNAKGLISVTQCTDFATCQFACETRPSYKELQDEGQEMPATVNPDDPVCDYVVMPSADTRSQFSFLFSMQQTNLKNMSFAQSITYDSFELICKKAPPSHDTSSQSVVVHAPPGQPPRQAHNRKARASENTVNEPSQSIRLRKCQYGDQEIECSKLITSKSSDFSKCMQLVLDHPTDMISVSLETTKPLELSIDNSDQKWMNRRIDLAPGHKYAIDLRNQETPKDSNKCGSKAATDRRCAAMCNDRMAIDFCGCTINNDPDMGYMNSPMVSTPLCDDNQLKSCVIDQLRSDYFFQCMDECKMECKQWNSMIVESAKSSENLVDLVLYLHIPQQIEAKPLGQDKQMEKFLQIWASVAVVGLMLLFLCIFLIFKCC